MQGGFQCLGYFNWTICSALSHFCSINFPTFSLSYGGAHSYYPRGPIRRKGIPQTQKQRMRAWGNPTRAFELHHVLSQFCSTAWGVFKIPCMWPGRELWVAGGRRGGNEWDRTTPEDTEEQFQCRRIRPADCRPSSVATAAPILPRCILGNTKSVGFRVMQAIMRPPPLSLSLSPSNLQLRSRSNRTFIHLSCGRSVGRSASSSPLRTRPSK